MQLLALILALLLSPILVGSSTNEPDWPQWKGLDRTGLSKETGLLKEWPAGGPPLVWSIKGLGEGYGTVAIKGNRIYIQGTHGEDSVLFCLNRADGKTVWMTPAGPRLAQDRGNGPRGTPTVDNERVYVLTEGGDLSCQDRRRNPLVAPKYPGRF